MNRIDLDIALYELSLDKTDLKQLRKKTKQHLNHALQIHHENDLTTKEKPLNTIIVFIEELSEFATEIINYELGQTTRITRIGVLEEIADVTLCVNELLFELNINKNIKKSDIKKYQRPSIPEIDDSLCLAEIANTQKLLTKYLRNKIDITADKHSELLNQIYKLYATMQHIITKHNISDDDIIKTRYVKTQTFVQKLYKNPTFVPNNITIYADIEFELDFNDETALGEPRAWIEFSNGTSLEICHEEDGLETPFYSIRLHCSENDFDNGDYKHTCGIMSSETCDNLTDVIHTVTDIVNNNLKQKITPILN